MGQGFPSRRTASPRAAQPAATPQPEPPETERNSAAFASGVDHGQAWGFNRAYLPDLQRLVEWVSTVRGNFSAQDVVAIVFPRPIGDWMRHDAAQLLAGDEDYARGFVVGAMLVWAHQLTKEPKGEKED